MTDDHELFNAHFIRGNKILNDLIEARRKEDEETMVSASDDSSNIMRKFEEARCDPYILLVGKFEHCGELQHHTITAGHMLASLTTSRCGVTNTPLILSFGTGSMVRPTLSITGYIKPHARSIQGSGLVANSVS